MKHLIFIAAIAFVFTSCSSSLDPAAQQALSGYKHFVDSIYAQNQEWKADADTIFIETPIDPKDPSKTRIDTMIKSSELKTTIVQDDFYGKPILEAYELLKLAVESNIAKMDDQMKNDFEASKKKFESLLVK